ncbi:hypothetical protein [Priestia megaterium]|uniref:hypothetical protein n=1 Tax=Priestia megaterium TaxID=1404 RepID=UPI002452F4AB|nr:hypothetical protein [Priestia megaterium]MDH3186671.1 hypothetical protein [Priestia megaterium]
MNIIKLFESELRNLDTNYFILDTKGKPADYGDIDFVSYDWSPSGVLTMLLTNCLIVISDRRYKKSALLSTFSVKTKKIILHAGNDWVKEWKVILHFKRRRSCPNKGFKRRSTLFHRHQRGFQISKINPYRH